MRTPTISRDSCPSASRLVRDHHPRRPPSSLLLGFPETPILTFAVPPLPPLELRPTAAAGPQPPPPQPSPPPLPAAAIPTPTPRRLRRRRCCTSTSLDSTVAPSHNQHPRPLLPLLQASINISLKCCGARSISNTSHISASCYLSQSSPCTHTLFCNTCTYYTAFEPRALSVADL